MRVLNQGAPLVTKSCPCPLPQEKCRTHLKQFPRSIRQQPPFMLETPGPVSQENLKQHHQIPASTPQHSFFVKMLRVLSRFQTCMKPNPFSAVWPSPPSFLDEQFFFPKKRFLPRHAYPNDQQDALIKLRDLCWGGNNLKERLLDQASQKSGSQVPRGRGCRGQN